MPCLTAWTRITRALSSMSRVPHVASASTPSKKKQFQPVAPTLARLAHAPWHAGDLRSRGTVWAHKADASASWRRCGGYVWSHAVAPDWHLCFFSDLRGHGFARGVAVCRYAELNKILRRGADIQLDAALLDGAAGEIETHVRSEGGRAAPAIPAPTIPAPAAASLPMASLAVGSIETWAPLMRRVVHRACALEECLFLPLATPIPATRPCAASTQPLSGEECAVPGPHRGTQ